MLQFHTRHFQQWTIPEKIQTWTEGLRTWNFQGYQRKGRWKLQGSLKKSLVSGGFKEKLMWNFHESWLLDLEYPRGVAQFYRISKVKVTKLKIPEGDFQKTISSAPPVWILCDNCVTEKILTRGEGWGHGISWGYIEKI